MDTDQTGVVGQRNATSSSQTGRDNVWSNMLTGTHINYYFVCNRKLWLFAHGMSIDGNIVIDWIV